MSRGYTSRRIAQAMQALRPVETPDTDAATLYEQRWRRRDGRMVRSFSVLALDEEMAAEMGGVRLAEKYNEPIMDWTLASNRPVTRHQSVIFEVLSLEDPDETKLREETFSERESASGAAI